MLTRPSISGDGVYNFGSRTVQATSMYSNALLVKYSTDFVSTQWVRMATLGEDNSQFLSVAVDSGWNVIAAGYIENSDSYTFGASVTAQGSFASGNNAVLVKYNSSGGAVWAKTVIGATAISQFKAIAVDSGNNVYAAGKISSTGSFGFGNGQTATGGGGTNPVLVKYNSDGAAQWARTKADNGNYAEFFSVAVDSSSNVYAAGTAYNGTDFGGGIVISAANSGVNLALVRYDSAGTAQRARTQIGVADNSEFTSVALGSGGTVYAAGILYGNSSYAFGDGVTAAGAYGGSGYNPVLVKYEE